MVCTASQPQPTAPAWHDPFLRILPIVRRYAHRSFMDRRGQAREEAVAEVVGHAMKAVRSLVLDGKDPTRFAACVAYFAVMRVKNGRLVAGIADGDIFSQLAQQRHGFTVRSLNDEDCGSVHGWRASVVQDSKHSTPAEVCCFKLDFEDWLASLSRQERRLITRLAVGDRPSHIARRVKRSPAWVTQLRARLKQSWQEFRGEAVNQDAALPAVAAAVA